MNAEPVQLLNDVTKVTSSFFLSFFLFYKFIYLFLATLGLCCCAWAFSSCGEQGLFFIAVRGLLIAVASLAVEHGLQAHGLRQLQHLGSVVVARGLQSAGSVVVVHGLSCSVACEIFLDQGSNPCPLHWQADSQPLCHQGSPIQLLSISPLCLPQSQSILSLNHLITG